MLFGMWLMPRWSIGCRMHHHSGGGSLTLRINNDCNLSSIKQSNLGFCPILRFLCLKSVSKPTRHFSRILYAITTMFSTIFSLLPKCLVTTWEGQPGIEPSSLRKITVSLGKTLYIGLYRIITFTPIYKLNQDNIYWHFNNIFWSWHLI